MRMLPIRAFDKSPPRQRMIERHRLGWGREYYRTGSQLVWSEVRKFFRVERTLGDGHVAGCLHESRKLFVRDVGAVDPKAFHFDLVNRLRVFHVIGSHPETSARNPNHAWWSIVRSGRPGSVKNPCRLDQCRRLQGVTRDSAV